MNPIDPPDPVDPLAPDAAERDGLAAEIIRSLDAAVAGSRAELRGSLRRGAGDAWSDLDVRWILPADAFPPSLDGVRAALGAVHPIEALRPYPDGADRADRLRLHVRFAELSPFWPLDLDVRRDGAVIVRTADVDEIDPELALHEIVSAIRDQLRGRPESAEDSLAQAWTRSGFAPADADRAMAERAADLVARIAAAHAELAGFARRVGSLAERAFQSGARG